MTIRLTRDQTNSKKQFSNKTSGKRIDEIKRRLNFLQEVYRFAVYVGTNDPGYRYPRAEGYCKELEAFYYSTRYSPFARHFIADVHDPMAIQFMIMNP
ncbi:unnamed protein product [Lasius platythorax]|uniref:Uncharacterized protein n=1 Tax=Lasius platythorax TaxID=488582 RepID=A0AAV2P3A1_9HYME